LERLRIALDQRLERLAEAGSREAIHDCRVAARKLRVASRALRRRPMQVQTGPLSKELKALLEGLAPARNADVRLQTLRDILLKTGSMNARKSRELLALAYAQHALLRRELSNLTKSPRWAQRRENLALRTMEVATLLEVREPAPQSLKEMIQRRDLGLRRRMGQIVRSPEKIHRLRLRIKELRYLLEAFEPLCGELDCVGLTELGRLQDLIGEFHDLWSLGKWLESDVPGDLVSRGLRRSLRTAQNRLLDKIISNCRGRRKGR
jgi:CHAD domain-containing protein